MELELINLELDLVNFKLKPPFGVSPRKWAFC